MAKYYTNRKNANKTTKKVPLMTLEMLQEMGYSVKEKLPSVRKYLWCHGGYDILENVFIVRHYVCQTEKMSFRVLEMLLKMYPMNYFNYQDFYTLPKNFQLVKADFFIKKGLLVEHKIKNKNRTESVFCLSAKARHIVENFYQYLSGEKKIPEQRRYNAMASPKATEIDKLRYSFIKKMNEKEPTEKMKKLYEGK